MFVCLQANELMVHTFYHMYGIQAVGLRFFTVYGPWGRPDMAVYKFADAIMNEKSININVNHDHQEFERDFTYVGDIVDGIHRSIKSIATDDTPTYKIYNLGTSDTHPITDIVRVLENCLQKKAKTQMLQQMNNGDVFRTMASTEKARIELGYKNNVSLSQGLLLFCDWYRNYH